MWEYEEGAYDGRVLGGQGWGEGLCKANGENKVNGLLSRAGLRGKGQFNLLKRVKIIV